ncbi:MAG: hypothetical protein ABI423_11290, partial [Burkholderiales bacterium]
RGAAGADRKQEVPAGKLGVFLDHVAPPFCAYSGPAGGEALDNFYKVPTSLCLIKRKKFFNRQSFATTAGPLIIVLD